MRNFLNFTLFLLFWHTALSQCPTGDVTFATQQDIEDFFIQYPNCENLQGDLSLLNSVSDLSRLNQIKRVEGNFYISGISINLINSFQNLEYVGGKFEIYNTGIVIINDFNKLRTVNGNFYINGNSRYLEEISGFTNLESVDDFRITENNALRKLASFDNLRNVSGYFMIRRANQLERITGFNNLLNVGVEYNPESFKSNFSIQLNDALVEINGFNSLKKVFRNLEIGGSRNLKRIQGFQDLEFIQLVIALEGCNLLEEIPTFENLKTIGAGIEINQIGIREISGFNNVEVIGDLDTQTGNININSNEKLERITGFQGLKKAEGELSIVENKNLISLEGFSNLNQLRTIRIVANSKLPGLYGLENISLISSLGGTAIDVYGNASLVDCSALCYVLSNEIVIGDIYIAGNPSKCSSEAEIRQECIPDFDKDGILDDDDLDDDNDGILDTVEQNGMPDRDTDNDGYPDHKDLDSDADGCLDVLEAGFSDADANGTLGNTPDTVDANGLIIGESDGYTTPADTDSDGVPDFQQANLLDAGLDSELQVCMSSNPIELITGLKGTPSSGGTWSPALQSNTGIFDPSADGPGVYTYTVDNGVCGVKTSRLTVIIDEEPNAGAYARLQLCESDTTLNLTDFLNGNPDANGSWSPVLNSGTSLFDPSLDSSGMYTYTVTNGTCGSVSAQIDVIIDKLPDAGSDGTLTICENSPPADLFESLNGTPDSGGEWTPALQSGTGVFDPAADASGVYTYTVNNTSCGLQRAQVQVIIDKIPNAGIDGSLQICETSEPISLLDYLSGTPDSNGIWNPALASGTHSFDPTIDAAGIYTYTVTSESCGSDTSQINIQIQARPNAGMDGNLEICVNSNPVNLFDYLQGSPDANGSWSPSLASGTGVFDPGIDPPGVYTYTVNNAVCDSDSSTIEIVLKQLTPISDYQIEVTDFKNTVEVQINSNLSYEYSLDGFYFQTGNVFRDLSGGDYTLFVREIDGCGILNTSFSILDYPRYFTPNGDGYNDYWKLKGSTEQDYSIQIFDRFGKLIKYLANPEDSWDGTFSGTPLPSNEYWFRIQFSDGTFKNGHITLKR